MELQNDYKEPNYKEVYDKYYELLYAVESKYEGESRHDTALRYIKNTERHYNIETTGSRRVTWNTQKAFV